MTTVIVSFEGEARRAKEIESIIEAFVADQTDCAMDGSEHGVDGTAKFYIECASSAEDVADELGSLLDDCDVSIGDGDDDLKRGKPRPLGRGRIALPAKPERT